MMPARNLFSPHALSPDLRAFQRALLRWYDNHRRDLPWRKTRDPYRIWISEIMLQQTRVAAVLEHYRLFVKRFPTMRAVAAASESQVLAAWSGLGYYRRARMLRQCAQEIVRDHNGRLPKTSAQLQSLPGIGRYTAAAIASIAFAEPVAVVDGNVERVLERLAGRSLSAKEIWKQAQELVTRSGPGDHNQAMMELGATVCTPRQPRCDSCPIRTWCASQAEALSSSANPRGIVNAKEGGTTHYRKTPSPNTFTRDTRREASPGGSRQFSPAVQRGEEARLKSSPGGTTHTVARRRASRQSKKEIWCTLSQRDGHVRLMQRPRNVSLMAGMWELPQWPVPPTTERQPSSPGNHWRTFRHSITTTDYRVHVLRGDAPIMANAKWIAIPRIPHMPITGLTRKILRVAGII